MPWRNDGRPVRLGVAALAPLALAACAGGGAGHFRPVRDTPVVVGVPYSVRGVTYAPADEADYDRVGYASWYGKAHEGRATANGERFEAARISAAHTTLPLPSYVEVTALDTGRTILARVNDRGPFVSGRIIDLSRGAAEQLGIARAGTAAVRVRRAYPAEAERARLRAGRSALARADVAPAELARLKGRLTGPAPRQAAVAPPQAGRAAAPRLVLTLPPPEPEAPSSVAPSSPLSSSAVPSSYAVRVGPFADRAQADRVARYLDGQVRPEASGWLVAKGPFATGAEADAMVRRLGAAGFNGARIVIND